MMSAGPSRPPLASLGASGAGAALVALLPLLGCAGAPAPLHLSNEWPPPSAVGDYREVTQKWTRQGTDRTGPNRMGRAVEQTLDLIATFKSPEWRAAYVKFKSEKGKLPASEVSALTAREQAELVDHYEVMMLVATYDRRMNDLQKGARSVWRIALVDAAGNEIVASEIKRDRRPRTEIQADFPQFGDFYEPYVARFPRTVDLLRPDAHRFSLKMTCSQASVELVWAERGASRTN